MVETTLLNILDGGCFLFFLPYCVGFNFYNQNFLINI